MSRPQARPRADHRHAADQARQMPGQWVLAGTYASSASAGAAAIQVRTGEKVPAYRPAGAYESRTELTQDGADLWVRFLLTSGPRDDYRDSLTSGLTETFDAFSSRLDAADTSRRTR